MSIPHDQRSTEIGAAVANAVRNHSTSFLVEGIILVLLGVLAIFVPLFATITVTVILGWILLASGIMGLITTFGARQAPGFWWSLLSALIAVGVGLILIAKPITGAVSLTLVLIVFFVVEGVATIIGVSCRGAGNGCLPAASSILSWPASFLPDFPERQRGRSGCSSASIWSSGAWHLWR
jgi:uncharacterized membrane protein HdeD (DUF308 family)